MSEWFAFTSQDGRVAGLAQRIGTGPRDFVGVALAVLETPCDLGEWQALLSEADTPRAAVGELLLAHGGAPVFKRVTFPDLHVVFLPPVVGEA